MSFRWMLSCCCLLAMAGCEPAAPPAPAPPGPPPVSSGAGTAPAPEDHHHDEGPHGGTVVDWGGGTYHVEFTVDHAKQESVVYVLGSDGKSPEPVKAEMILLSIDDPAFQVELAADPLAGEADGMSSRFVGTHKNLGIVKEYSGTISGDVDGTPYTGDFKEEPHAHEE